MEESAAEPVKSGGSKAIVFLLVGLLIGAAIGAGIMMALGGGDDDGDDDIEKSYLSEGFKLELFFNSGNANRELACLIMKQNLELLNPGKIQIKVSGVEWSQYLELREQGAMPAMFLGWAPDYADPDNYVQPFYHQSGTYASMIGYGNDTLDAMIEDAATDIDPVSRAAKYKDISMDMYQECVFIWTAQATNFHAERDWLTGYEFNPMHSGLIYYQYDKPDTAPAGAPAGYSGDTFTAATISGNPESLDPAIGYETAGGEIMQNVYETLLFYNGSSASELVPVLASEIPTVDNGGILDNGTKYVFNLKTGVKFHDGTNMTSEDVRYSLERALAINDPHGPAWMLGQVLIPDFYTYEAGYWNTTQSKYIPGVPLDVISEHVWAVDADTIQLNLTSPYPAFLYAMCYNVGSVISKSWVGPNYGFDFNGTAANNKLATDMCGTGPYTFESWTRNVNIILKAFPDYHMGEAAIENVVIQQIGSGATRILMLKSGEVDWAFIDRASKGEVEDYDGINVTQGIGTFNVDFLGLNQNLNLDALPNPENTNVPADFFADRNVRLAFAHAFNYDQYIEDGLLGTAIQPNGAIPKGMFAYSEDIPVYAYNLEWSKLYLSQALIDEDEAGAEANILAEIIARIKF